MQDGKIDERPQERLDRPLRLRGHGEKARFNFLNAWPSKVDARHAAGRRQRSAARGVHDHARRDRARMSRAPCDTTSRARHADALRTEFAFELPRGYVDDDGDDAPRRDVMRLATARDEILPLRDPRVRDNEATSRCSCCRGSSPSSAHSARRSHPGRRREACSLPTSRFSRISTVASTRRGTPAPSCAARVAGSDFEVDVAGDGLGGS